MKIVYLEGQEKLVVESAVRKLVDNISNDHMEVTIKYRNGLITEDEFDKNVELAMTSIELIRSILGKINSKCNSSLCDGCAYKPGEGKSYPLEPCNECSRWYGDMFEDKNVDVRSDNEAD